MPAATPQSPSSTSGTVDIPTLLAIVIPLACVAGVISHFELESRAFAHLTMLATGGFVVHYFLPLRFRLAWFFALSLGGLVLLLGVAQAAWILGLGALLIGICHLPISYLLRVLVLLAVGAVLVAMRMQSIPSPWSPAIWPVFASMFMFRLIIYMYDRRHEPGLGTFWARVSYFFLLPNVCFPLFPVVDYKTFVRNYYNVERHRIYHKGLHWIFRGVVQLLLYRLAYQTIVIDPVDVRNVVDLAHYLLWPFLLYLRVSGQFHIVVGILHLFGFNLPETHHSYYLSSSFTDLWRRINIYWKDFMMKVFYYPAYFALRKRGGTLALVLSTLFVFFATWLLHSYQWFWFRGSWLVTTNDVAFWSLLALFVVCNSVYEYKHGQARTLPGKAQPWPKALRSTLATLGVFSVLSVLWSLWSTESMSTWLSLWSAARTWSYQGPAWVPVFVVAVPLTVAGFALANARAWGAGITPTGFQSSGAVMVLASAALVALSVSPVYSRLGRAGDVIGAVRFGGLNAADAENMERGYYENLMGVDRFNGDLWALYMNRPRDWERGLVEAGLARTTTDARQWELLPSAEGRFKGAILRTNRWALHDKDYEKVPPSGCYRIALLGASHEMGTGVEREQTFEAVLEDHLNADSGALPRRCYEIINFAVYGYNPLVQIGILEQKVADFHPHAIFYVGHPGDAQRVVHELTREVVTKSKLESDDLSAIVRAADVSPGLADRLVAQRLAPFGERILDGLYRHLMDEARQRGICAGYVFLPLVPKSTVRADVPAQLQLARDAGFTVIDLSGVYDVPDNTSLWIAEWDAHPNSRGHRLVADRLYTLLQRDGADLFRCDGHRTDDPSDGLNATGGAASRATPAAVRAVRLTD